MRKLFKRLLYMLPTALSVTTVLCHHSHIHLSYGSFGVLAVVGTMLLMFFIYRGKDVSATGFYSASPTADAGEEKQLAQMHAFARILLCMMPLQLIFVFLFSNDLIKGLGAIGVLFLAILINIVMNLIQKKAEEKESWR